MFTHVITSTRSSRCGPHFRARPPHASANTGCLNRGIPGPNEATGQAHASCRLRDFASEASSQHAARLSVAENSMHDNYPRPNYNYVSSRRPSEYDDTPKLTTSGPHAHKLQRVTKPRLCTSSGRPQASRYSLYLY